MAVAAGTDPRRQAEAPDSDVRPQVALARPAVAGWLIAAVAIIGGILLFTVLDAQRRALTAPSVRPRVADLNGAPTPLTPLFVPPAPPPVVLAPVPAPVAPAPFIAPRPAMPPQPQIVYVPQPAPAPQPEMPRPRVSTESALVIDTTTGEAAIAAAPAGGNGEEAPSAAVATRAQASVMRNRSTTVPQGTLIPAVLETALDSTRPGFARALVTRDVKGFDGSRILIPRGSRLVGEYRSDLARGQNRALVTWTRLVRPDGVTIALASPAADPLGRVGIKGRVNTHFFEQFGAAILQSALDIGVNLATQTNNSQVIIGLPGVSQSLTRPLTEGANVTPTLRVRQGTTITVFVARDLDFTSVGAVR
jgi:type IV secretion system protein VirB10